MLCVINSCVFLYESGDHKIPKCLNKGAVVMALVNVTEILLWPEFIELFSSLHGLW